MSFIFAQTSTSPLRTIKATARPTVIALHCSGSSGRQWRHLAETLNERFWLLTPDLLGSGREPHWSGERPFTLADEAACAVDIIDHATGPVHLIGHSYGGAVALRVATMRPSRIASLSLYEPSAFHLLRQMGDEGRQAAKEVETLGEAAARGVLNGAYQLSAQRFIDYWSGTGAWISMKPEQRAEMVRYLPKACLEFRAVFGERMPLAAYRRLNIPTLFLRGEHAPQPARMIVDKLSRLMRPTYYEVLPGVGHMGPVTHADRVNQMLVDHVMRNTPPDAEEAPRIVFKAA